MDTKKFLINTSIVLAVVGIISIGAYKQNQGNLNKNLNKKFDNAHWIKYDNKDGKIWGEYMNEHINHNKYAWKLYQEKVNEKNPNGLTGKIELPDLDNDDYVGEKINNL